MIPYVFCTLVEGVLYARRDPLSQKLTVGPYVPFGTIAFVFTVGTIYGAGPEAGMWALILLMLAVPVWLLLCAEQRRLAPQAWAATAGGTTSWAMRRASW